MTGEKVSSKIVIFYISFYISVFPGLCSLNCALITVCVLLFFFSFFLPNENVKAFCFMYAGKDSILSLNKSVKHL